MKHHDDRPRCSGVRLGWVCLVSLLLAGCGDDEGREHAGPKPTIHERGADVPDVEAPRRTLAGPTVLLRSLSRSPPRDELASTRALALGRHGLLMAQRELGVWFVDPRRPEDPVRVPFPSEPAPAHWWSTRIAWGPGGRFALVRQYIGWSSEKLSIYAGTAAAGLLPPERAVWVPTGSHGYTSSDRIEPGPGGGWLLGSLAWGDGRLVTWIPGDPEQPIRVVRVGKSRDWCPWPGTNTFLVESMPGALNGLSGFWGLTVFDVESGDVVRKVTLDSRAMFSKRRSRMAFNARGDRLLLADPEGVYELWEPGGSWTLVHRGKVAGTAHLRAHWDQATGKILLLAGRRILIADGDGRILGAKTLDRWIGLGGIHDNVVVVADATGALESFEIVELE